MNFHVSLKVTLPRKQLAALLTSKFLLAAMKGGMLLQLLLTVKQLLTVLAAEDSHATMSQ